MISRRFRIPLLALCALVLALVFAATAAAEKKGGEVESPVDMSLPGEADILKGSVVYDVATGSVTATFTTREGLGSDFGESPPQIEYAAGLLTSNRPCTQAAAEEEEKAGGPGFYPRFILYTFNGGGGAGLPDRFSLYEAQNEGPVLDPSKVGPATKSIAGTTMMLNAIDARAASGPFTCVEIGAFDLSSGGTIRDLSFFPLTVLPDPPPVIPSTLPAAAVPAPPAPAALTIAKPKSLSLTPEKWTPVRITVTNTGATATPPGSLQLKVPRTMKVRPVSSRQRIPAIQPGRSWNVAFRVKPTEETRRRSRISFVAGAGGLSARGSIVAKFSG